MNEPAKNIIIPSPTQLKPTATSMVIPNVLPHERMYTIKVGDIKFTMSGASLSYDSPSYFTDYFTENPTVFDLTIDRSPKIFDKIYQHLQGYSIQIKDDFEFIHLLMDASYLRLKKLYERLIAEGMIINVGGKLFKIPKEVATTKGNYPNFFSIIYNSYLMDPYAKTKDFIRPPPVTPYICNKSSENFQLLIDALNGYKISVKDENHRSNLLSDCRYYHFFALEQKLIKHQIFSNPFTNKEEILLDYKDVKKQGLLNDTMNSMIGSNNHFAVVKYSRPFVDTDVYRDLIIQIDSNDVNLMVNTSMNFINLLIYNKTAIKLKAILSAVTDDYIYEDLNDKPTLTVLIRMNDSVGLLNGLKMEQGWLDTLINVNTQSTANNIQTNHENHKIIVIKLLKSQWTINVQGRSKIWMDGVKFEGVLDLSHFNETRGFL